MNKESILKKIGIWITIISFVVLSILTAIDIVRVKPESVDQWFTLLLSPASILLGIFSIIVADKAKSAVDEAKTAIIKKYENKEKEELYISLCTTLNNCSLSITQWIYPKDSELIDPKQIIGDVEKITRTVHKEPILYNDEKIKDTAKNIRDAKNEIESKMNSNFEPLTGEEKKLREAQNNLQDNVDELYRILKEKKGEL